EAEQSVLGCAERGVAELARVGSDLNRVVVAAAFAPLGGVGDRAATGLASVAGELDAHDLVARALVVDQRPGAELADRDEPGALQVVAVHLAAAPGRDVRSQGQ